MTQLQSVRSRIQKRIHSRLACVMAIAVLLFAEVNGRRGVRDAPGGRLHPPNRKGTR